MSELLTTARAICKSTFKSCEGKNMIDSYLDMLGNLNKVVADNSMQNILLNDSYDSKYKISLLTEILKESSDESFIRFVKLLVENNRLLVVAEIIGLYDNYSKEEKSLKIAIIDTAYELNDEQVEKIKAAATYNCNKKIELDSIISAHF